MPSRFKLCCVTLSPLFRSVRDLISGQDSKNGESIRTLEFDVVLNIYILTRVNFGIFLIFSAIQCEYLRGNDDLLH